MTASPPPVAVTTPRGSTVATAAFELDQVKLVGVGCPAVLRPVAASVRVLPSCSVELAGDTTTLTTSAGALASRSLQRPNVFVAGAAQVPFGRRCSDWPAPVVELF